jgi:acetyltransferase-like isoleucine patch superfamily enzyme
MSGKNCFIHPSADVSDNATIGNSVKIWNNAQVREKATIGDNVIISKNVYIDHAVQIGNNVKIQNNASVYQGTIVHDGVFIGPHVCFANDLIPRAINLDGNLKNADDWHISPTIVKKGASIGASSVVLPGVVIGSFAMIGSGSVVTRNVSDHALVYGNPARLHGYVCFCGNKLENRDGRHYCASCNKEIKISGDT